MTVPGIVTLNRFVFPNVSLWEKVVFPKFGHNEKTLQILMLFLGAWADRLLLLTLAGV